MVNGCHNCGDGLDKCSYECYWMHKAEICVDIKGNSMLVHYFKSILSDDLDANLPESYFITSDGLTARTYPDLLGEYLLLKTQYKGIKVLLYKRTSQITGNIYYLFNRTSSQKNGDWIVKKDANTLLRAEGNWSLFQAPNKGWKLVLWKRGYDVLDNSLSVRVDDGNFFSITYFSFWFYVFKLFPDCLLSEWRTGDCSKECGGGYQTNTRQILRPAVQDGECRGELERTEHCDEQHCPGVKALIGLVFLAIFGATGGVVYYLNRRGIISFKHEMIPTSLKNIKWEMK